MNTLCKLVLTLNLLAAPFVASAQATQTDNITFNAPGYISSLPAAPDSVATVSLPITQFDSSLGTLQSISTTITGVVSGPGAFIVSAAYGAPFYLTLGQSVISPAPYDDVTFTNTEPESVWLAVGAPNGVLTDTFFIGTYDGTPEVSLTSISGTVTYNYAPAVATVPEIDPTSAASGLALLVGGLVVLAGRRPQRLTA